MNINEKIFILRKDIDGIRSGRISVRLGVSDSAEILKTIARSLWNKTYFSLDVNSENVMFSNPRVVSAPGGKYNVVMTTKKGEEQGEVVITYSRRLAVEALSNIVGSIEIKQIQQHLQDERLRRIHDIRREMNLAARRRGQYVGAEA